MKGKFVWFMTIVACLMLSVSAWAGSIQIKGSTTVLPIAQKIAEQFMKEFPDVNISISGGGSGNGVKALIDGTTDIADASRFIKQKEVDRAVKNGRYLRMGCIR